MEEIEETVELPVFSIKAHINSSAKKVLAQVEQVLDEVGKTPLLVTKISDSVPQVGHIVRALYAV